MIRARTRWAVGSSPGGADVVAWQLGTIDANGVARESLDGAVVPSLLIHAHTYHVTLEATNGAGSTAIHPRIAAPITMDYTPPLLGLLAGGGRRSPHGALYWPHVDALTVGVRASDPESGIVSLRARIVEVSHYVDAFLNRTSSLTTPWTVVSLGANSSFSGVLHVAADMDRGAAYVVEVETVNGASTLVVNTSLVFLPDDTPPNCTAVHDWTDPTRDRDFINVMTRVAANWVCVDPESLLAQNEWSANITTATVTVGGVPVPGPVLFDSSLVGDAPVAISDEFVLPHGSVVHVAVEAANGAGLTTHLDSSGIFYDATPPVPGRVMAADFTPFDGASEFVGVAFQTSTQALSVVIQDFVEPESAPLQCLFSTLCSRGGTPAEVWNGTRSDHSAPCSSLPARARSTLTAPAAEMSWLEHGDVCYTSVTVLNRAGGDVVAVTGQVVIDTTPPTIEHVAATALYGTLTAAEIIASNYAVDGITIIATVAGVEDPESGIQFTNVTVTNKDQVLANRLAVDGNNASAVNYTFVVDVVDSREPVKVIVRAVNGARNDVIVEVDIRIEIPVLAHGVAVDGTEGVASRLGQVTDVWPANNLPEQYRASSRFVNDPTSLWTSWVGFTNPTETVSFTWGLCLNASCPVLDEVALGTTGLAPASLFPAGSGASVAVGAVDLQHGQFYRSLVNASDTAGNWVSNLTSGFLVDVTPPVWSSAVTVAAANSSVATRAVTAVLPTMSVGNNSLVSRAPVPLQWHAVDDESSVDQVVVMAGLTPGATDFVAPFFQPGLSRSLTVSLCTPAAASQALGAEDGLGCVPASALLKNATHGDTIHVTMFARNRAGSWGIASESGPITVDASAPQVSLIPVVSATSATAPSLSTSVHNTAGEYTRDLRPHPVVERVNGTRRVVHVSYVRSPEALGVRWNTQDAESTVETLEWCAGSAPGSDVYAAWSPLSVADGLVWLSSSVLQGNDTAEVYFTLRATNAVGMQRIGYSARVVKDATPPQLADATAAAAPVLATTADTDALGASTHSIVTNWGTYLDPESGIAAYVWWAVQATSAAQHDALHRNVSVCVAQCVEHSVSVQDCASNCTASLDDAGVVVVVHPRIRAADATRDAVSELPLLPFAAYQVHLTVVNRAGGWTSSVSPLFFFDTRAPAATGEPLRLTPMTQHGATFGFRDHVSTPHPRLVVSEAFADITASVSTVEWEVVRFRAGQGVRPQSAAGDGVLAESAPNLKAVDTLTSGVVVVNTTAAIQGATLDNVTVSLLYAPRGERLVVRAKARGLGGVPSATVLSQPFVFDPSPPIPGAVSVSGAGLTPGAAAALGMDAAGMASALAAGDHRSYRSGSGGDSAGSSESSGSVPRAVLPARRDAVVNVTWEPFADAESPLVQYTVCHWVERLPAGLGCCDTLFYPNATADAVLIPGPAGCPCEQPAAPVGNRSCTNMTADTRAFAATYVETSPHLQVVAVAGTNAAGLVAWSERVDVIVDPTPPLAGVVLDGDDTYVDVDFSPATDAVHATFDRFVDHESGMLGYLWSALVDGVAIVENEWVGDVRRVSRGHLQLQAESHVVVHVTAVSRTGATVTNSSDGVVVLPHAAVVPSSVSVNMTWNMSKPHGVVMWPIPFLAHQVQPVAVTSDSRRVGMAWDHFLGVSPAFMSYEWTVCPQFEVLLAPLRAVNPTSCLLPFLPVRNRTRGAGLVTLAPGVGYVGVLRATTAAGLVTMAVSSNVIAGDDTPPVVGGVYHGSPVERSLFQSNCTHVQVWWQAPLDLESGVAQYSWSLGTGDQSDNVLPRTTITGVTPLSAEYRGTASGLDHGCTVPPFGTIIATLYVTNGAGLESVAVSEGVYVDPTPPIPGGVFVGFDRSNAVYQMGDAGVQASWTRFTDDESDIDVRFLLVRVRFVKVVGGVCAWC